MTTEKKIYSRDEVERNLNKPEYEVKKNKGMTYKIAEKKVCRWFFNRMSDWQTSCGTVWFMPIKSSNIYFKFCPFCGAELVEESK